MSRFPPMPSDARVAFAAGAIVAAVAAPAFLAIRTDKPAAVLVEVALPQPSISQPEPEFNRPVGSNEQALDRPVVNYRGPIRLIRDHGEDHPSPEVFPRTPLEIVTDDCAQLDLFHTDDELWDPENGLLVLSWLDPGVDESRSLTIFTQSPSCGRNADVRRAVAFREEMDAEFEAYSQWEPPARPSD